MKMTNTPTRFGWLSILNHWTTAVLFLGMLGFGWILDEMEKGPLRTGLMQWHQSIGIVILVLVALRLVWAWISPRPGPSTGTPWEKTVARVVQALLWIGLLGMPLSGWVMSAAGGHAVSFFGWFDLPSLLGQNEMLHETAEEAHGALAAILVAAIALHVAGALKHHFLDRDATLTRMLPQAASKSP